MTIGKQMLTGCLYRRAGRKEEGTKHPLPLMYPLTRAKVPYWCWGHGSPAEKDPLMVHNHGFRSADLYYLDKNCPGYTASAFHMFRPSLKRFPNLQLAGDTEIGSG